MVDGDKDIDPNDLCVTLDSVGNNSDGNGGDAVVDVHGRGFASSSPLSSSTIPDLDLELDHNHHQVNPEYSPTPNLQRLRLVSPVLSPTTAEDDVLIMDGVLVDNGLGTPSSVSRSVSFVDNGLGNRRSASMSDLILVSSGFHGSSGDGSTRRSGYGGQGSSNRWQAGLFNLQQGPQFQLPAHNIQLGQHQLSLPYGMHQQYPFHMNMTPPPPYLSPWQPGPRASYTYAPAAVTVQPSAHYNYNQLSGSGGVFPVDIRRPDGTPLTLPPPPQPAQPPRRPVAPLVISAPPANRGRAPAPERPETQPPAPRVAGAAAPQAPTARAFSWPPTVEEESAIWYALHDTSGNRRRARLPVFRGICSDSTESRAPPPPPASPRP
ncbi:unnamed protein product [Urochloa decumbens]|uniref:Uncharacterized protein n=1 Tax=Urochloa decumbens TaxID=240449 RepID=A0ABC8WT83_9POAL